MLCNNNTKKDLGDSQINTMSNNNLFIHVSWHYRRRHYIAFIETMSMCEDCTSTSICWQWILVYDYNNLLLLLVILLLFLGALLVLLVILVLLNLVLLLVALLSSYYKFNNRINYRYKDRYKIFDYQKHLMLVGT